VNHLRILYKTNNKVEVVLSRDLFLENDSYDDRKRSNRVDKIFMRFIAIFIGSYFFVRLTYVFFTLIISLHLLSFNYHEQYSHFRINYTFTNGEAKETEILRRLQDPSGWNNPSADTARRFLAFPETNWTLSLYLSSFPIYITISKKSQSLSRRQGFSFSV